MNLSSLRNIALPLLFTAIFAQTAFSNEKYIFPGKAYYPLTAELLIHKTELTLPEEKKFMGAVIEGLLDDYIRLQQRVYFPGRDPYKIEYPYPPILQNEIPVTNPREIFLKKNPPPEYYPLLVRRTDTMNISPEEEADKFHLKLKLSQKDQKGETFIYNLRTTLYRGKKQILELKKEFAEENAVKELLVLTTQIRKQMAGEQTAEIHVESDQPDTSIYLNEVFLGKSPVSAKFLSPGKYSLILRKQGFLDKSIPITLKTDDKPTFKETLLPFNGIGKINLSSSPAGAKVYLGIEYKGLTPLTLAGLPLGAHRIHLVKDGMGDIFKSVNLTSGQPELALDFTMPPGSTKSRLDPERPVLGSLSHKNLFIGSLVFTLASFGGGVYFFVQRDTARESKFAGLSTTSPALYTQTDISRITYYDQKIDSYEKTGNMFLYISLAGVISSFYFYLQTLFDQDLEIAMNKKLSHENMQYGFTGMHFYQSAQDAVVSVNYAF